MKILLASASPRRKQLLEELGHQVTVVRPRFEEEQVPMTAPEAYVQTLAEGKGRSVPSQKDALIVAADTVVVFEGAVLGKPRDEREAEEMLSALSGKTHQVYTGVYLKQGKQERTFVDQAEVTFRTLTKKEIADYIATGSPMDKAGAYGVQDSGFAAKIHGSFHTVMGFPTQRFSEEVQQFQSKNSEEKMSILRKGLNALKFWNYTDIGIDLGTANTIVYRSGKGIVLREPSVVAIDTVANRVVAVGQEAKDMIGRTPDSIRAVRPLKEGVIADFESGSAMLRFFLKKTMGKNAFSKKRILICIPFGVTDVEHRAVENAAYETGAKDVRIIEEPLAAAIGAGLPVGEPTGSMVVDIGGGTSEVAVISLGGIVSSRSVRVAGDSFDAAIVAYVKKHFNLLIGDRTAEEIKFEIGSAYPYDGEGEMSVRGRDLITGLPKNISISAAHIREALAESVQVVIDAIKQTLEDTPPELAADIIDHGITLTGGGAFLRGLDTLISKTTGMPVYIAKDPLDCVALGTGKSLENPILWASLAR